MILDVEFNYKATVVRRQKRLAETFVYRASTYVDLRDLTQEQAPLAARYRDLNWSQMVRAGDLACLQPEVELRWFEGGLWRRKEAVKDFVGSGLQWLAFVASMPTDKHNPFMTKPEGSHRGVLEADEEVRSVESSGLDWVVAELGKKALDFVVIGGALWTTEIEPQLLAGRRNYRGHDVSYVQVAEGRPFWTLDPNDRFRLDQYDKVAQIRPDLAAKLAETAGVVGLEPAIEVFLPEAFVLPADEFAVLRWGNSFFDLMDAVVRQQDAAYFKAYMDLRETLKGASWQEREVMMKLPDGFDMPAYAEALRAAVEVEAARLAGKGVPEGDREKGLGIVEMCRLTLARYDMGAATQELSCLAGM
jgi:hypothetical protein